MGAKLRRTFHPVGQGAFYTEEVLVNGKCKFAVVYDCGAMGRCNDNSAPSLQDTVRAFSPAVDYIVLSHLHDDHINGVQYLNVKANRETKILLPLLTGDGEICVTVHNCLSAYTSGTPEYYRTYAEVENHLSNYGRLVHIPYDGNPKEGQDDIDQEDEIISSALLLTDKEQLLTWSLRDFGTFKWKYKFFNAHTSHEAEIVARLMSIPEILTDGAVDEGKIVAAFKINSTEVVDKIKKAYGPPTRINQTCMMMYSGPYDPEAYKEPFTRNVTYPLLCHRSIFPLNKYYKLSCCLYCGDRNLTSKKNAIMEYYKDEWDYIEIIQVPHHGAKRNFDKDLTTPPKVFFVSYGTKNIYSHPSQEVTDAIVNSGCLLFHVLENPSAMVTYNITIR